MRSFVQTRRGLSTVVTTAIMLSAVAVLGTALIGWSNSNLKVFETGLSTSSADKTNKINENLQIENVWFYKNKPILGQNGGVNVTLTNGGTVGLTVTDIKIIDSAKSYDFPQNVAILPSKSYSAVGSPFNYLAYVWHSQVPITISVTTARGLIYTTQAAPP